MKRRFRLERQKLTLLNVSSAPGSQLPYLQEKARIEMAGVLETVPGGRTGRRSGPWEERGHCSEGAATVRNPERLILGLARLSETGMPPLRGTVSHRSLKSHSGRGWCLP